MSRYRRVHTRIHASGSFARLSNPQPCGKYLFFYLITGAHTGPIPGLSVAGEAQLAEALGWPLKGFREAFAEVFAEEMAEADWQRRVVWLPKAITFNEPESPNVIRGWRNAWEEIPGCALKDKAFQGLRAFTEGLGQGFQKAFAEAIAKGFCQSGTGTGTGTGEEEQTLAPSGKPRAERARPVPVADESFQSFKEHFPKWAAGEDALKAWHQTAGKRPPLPDLLAVLDRQARECEDLKFFPHPATWLRGGRWGDAPVLRPANGGIRAPARPGRSPMAPQALDELHALDEKLRQQGAEWSASQGRT